MKMRPVNIVVFDEEKFEKWLRQMGIEFEKTDEEYRLKTPVNLKVRIPPGVQVAELGGRIDANKITDLKTKLGALPYFLLKVRSLPVTAACSNFTEFCSVLQSRLTMGSMKYGESWKQVDLLHELEQELYDIANYAYLEWLKRKRKIKPVDEVKLVSVAASAVVLWQFVRDMKAERDGKKA